MDADSVGQAITHLRAKYGGDVPLFKRLDDAIGFGRGEKADAFFLHDSADVVNLIWLNADGIRDVTWLPRQRPDGKIESEEPHQHTSETIFNFLPLNQITSFEVRESSQVARKMGPNVSGDFMVQVFLGSSPHGQLYWIASNPAEVAQLRGFLQAVLAAFARY